MPETPAALKHSVIYLSHGGGPLPLLGDPGHRNLLAFIRNVTPTLINPSAIVVISAHWEERVPTITSDANPALIYDYYGFPKAAYDIQYPAPGSPQLAQHLYQMFQQTGIDAKLDENRGFDHGLFVPLKLMYPDASIPCVQLSLIHDLNPEHHLHMGKALAALTDQNILLIGSGFSFHNLNAFFSPSSLESQMMNAQFEHWLQDILTNEAYTEMERAHQLIHWTDTPAARYCHPREEHLLPLHVCYGAANSRAQHAYQFEIMGKLSSAFIW